MKQSKPNGPGRVLPEPFQKPHFGVRGRTASSYWANLSWLHMKMAVNPLDQWQKMKQWSFLYFRHNPQVLLAGWTAWFDVNISAQNSIIHPQLHHYRKVWKERCEFSRSQAMRAESLARWSLEGEKNTFQLLLEGVQPAAGLFRLPSECV